MNGIVLLDASPLGMISNPSATPANLECYNWMESLLTSGYQIIVPEIADYEVRRELLRAGKILGLARLDLLKKHTQLFTFDNRCYAQSRRTLGTSSKPRHANGGRKSPGLRRDFGGSGDCRKWNRCHRKCRPSFFICRSKRLPGYFAVTILRN